MVLGVPIFKQMWVSPSFSLFYLYSSCDCPIIIIINNNNKNKISNNSKNKKEEDLQLLIG